MRRASASPARPFPGIAVVFSIRSRLLGASAFVTFDKEISR
jgi:hypothetical protein